MQWERTSGHKGLLDINATEKQRKHPSPKHRNIPDIRTIKNKCNKIIAVRCKSIFSFSC
jgi:hypothetical protein